VSSAILYLAIIAIWAGFLVPAWVRRPHATPASPEEEFAAGSYEDAERDDPADGELMVEYVTETENDVEVTLGADVHVEVTRHERESRSYEYSEHEYSEDPREPQEHGASGYPGYGSYAPDSGEAGYGAADRGSPEPIPSQSREQMLRARRKILKILAAMTVITGAFVALGAAKWWICVPPAGMLLLYVLMLREIALADAELARKRADWEAAQARAYRRRLRVEAEREAYEAAHANPGAQIIDISGRVTDQLYDQYADAAVRAVGD